jgi:hypothetical protein
MMDSDSVLVLILLTVVLIALLAPPGPGTPLRSPVRVRLNPHKAIALPNLGAA